MKQRHAPSIFNNTNLCTSQLWPELGQTRTFPVDKVTSASNATSDLRSEVLDLNPVTSNKIKRIKTDLRNFYRTLRNLVLKPSDNKTFSNIQPSKSSQSCRTKHSISTLCCEKAQPLDFHSKNKQQYCKMLCNETHYTASRV